MKSFLKNLFDLSFDKFVAVHVVRVTFIIGCLGAALLAGYLADDPSDGHLFVRILVCYGVPPTVFIACVAVWRVTLEMYVALVRIAENTTKLVEMKDSKEALQVNAGRSD